MYEKGAMILNFEKGVINLQIFKGAEFVFCTFPPTIRFIYMKINRYSRYRVKKRVTENLRNGSKWTE